MMPAFTGLDHRIRSIRRIAQPFAAAGGPSPSSLTWTDFGTQTTDTTTPNLGIQSIGAADADRVVVVAVAARVNTGGVFSAVKMHAPNLATDPTGTAMTLVTGSDAANATMTASIWHAPFTGETTAEFVGTTTQTAARSMIEVYSLITQTKTPAAGAKDSNVNQITLNEPITVPASGFGLAIFAHQTGGAGTTGVGWTNATEDAGGQVVNLETFLTGESAQVAPGTVTVTATLQGTSLTNNVCVLALAAWSP